MWVIEFFEDVELAGVIFFASLFLILIFGFSLIVFGHIMHPFLTKRFDPMLFNEHWFSLPELAMFSGWPLSLLKSGHYMFLISFPKFSRRRRFKGVATDLNIPLALLIASRIFMALHIIFVIIGLTFAVSGIYGYFFYEEPPN